ncbi:MAG TPA: hypothetical protein VFB27_15000 [Opitutaceae bacterium]|nr:hypothetical protein [Opitutaceae bacterium]
MKLIRPSPLFVLLCFCAGLRGAPIQHDFLAIDEGLSNLMRVDEKSPKKNWLVHIGKDHPRDMQLIGGNRLLISHDQGYAIFDLTTGKLLKDVSLYHDISSVRCLPNGHLLVIGVDFDLAKKNKGDNPLGDPTGRHVIFAEFDANDKVVRRTAYIGDYARLVRETAQGTFLCGCNTMFREGDANGNWIREIPVEGFTHAWKAVRLPNGDTLMSAGYGTSQKKGSSFMVEVDATGKIVRKFGAAGDVPPEVHPYFYATFQLLPNGDVVVANWQGHRAGHNYSGVQILEFDPKGAIVWEWSDRAFVSSVQAVLVLDGLDPAVLHDERNGVMEPLASAP